MTRRSKVRSSSSIQRKLDVCCLTVQLQSPTYATCCLCCRSPFFIEVEDPKRDLIDPAVKGTENVLKSVIKHKKTVQRTVVTSSVAGWHLLCYSIVASAVVRRSKTLTAFMQLCLAMRALCLPRMEACTRRTTGTRLPASRITKLIG